MNGVWLCSDMKVQTLDFFEDVLIICVSLLPLQPKTFTHQSLFFMWNSDDF